MERGKKEMIDLSGIMGIPLLKKSRFTGSYKSLRYILERQSDEEKGERLAAVFWIGENCYDATPQEEKTTQWFPFDEEGLKAAQEWLNIQAGNL